MTAYIDIVFDGPPGHESGRFVEVDNAEGRSISAGKWLQRQDGYWVLRIDRTAADALRQAADHLCAFDWESASAPASADLNARILALRAELDR